MRSFEWVLDCFSRPPTEVAAVIICWKSPRELVSRVNGT